MAARCLARALPRHLATCKKSCRFSSSSSSSAVDIHLNRKKSSKPPAPPSDVVPEAFLLKSLKDQMKQASAMIQKYQIAIKASFEPFELMPNVGTSDLTLRRQIDDEEVVVKCIMDSEEPEDEEYLLEDDLGALKIHHRLHMNIRISKGSIKEGPGVAFLCTYMSESIVIQEVAYFGSSSQEGEYPYSGPHFPDLNAKLQEAFQNVLKARGIDSTLADLIMDHLGSKYQSEYILWLQKIRSFLKQ